MNRDRRKDFHLPLFIHAAASDARIAGAVEEGPEFAQDRRKLVHQARCAVVEPLFSSASNPDLKMYQLDDREIQEFQQCLETLSVSQAIVDFARHDHDIHWAHRQSFCTKGG